MANTFTMTPASSPETTETTLLERAMSPKRVTTDEGSVEERPVDDIIKAKNYDAAVAAEGPLHGLRVSRCKPSGAV